MRDIWLVAWVALGLGFTLRYPFVGVLIWEWLSLMAPHMEAYGFSRTLQLNLVVALVTIFSWLISKEPKNIPTHPIIILSALFLAWMTFNSFFAFDTHWSWPYWDRTWKIFFFGFLVAAMANSRARIEALIWVAVISLLYFGIKGGLFTLASGGKYKVYGPEGTIIGDNNQLALAIVMILPLIAYLRANASTKLIAWILGASILASVVSIVGSYSRGAYIAMASIGLFALLRTKRKFTFFVMLLVLVAAAIFFTPAEIVDRMSSIQTANEDASFHGRLVAWQVAFRYAIDHFPFGAGFYGPQLGAIFQHYFPAEMPHAAHSIYFQVLGEHGFVGIFLYFGMLFTSFRLCWKISRTKQKDDSLWIQNLSGMLLISLFAFMIGGAALSMAYYDLFIIIICILPQLALLSEPIKSERFRASAQTGVTRTHAY